MLEQCPFVFDLFRSDLVPALWNVATSGLSENGWDVMGPMFVSAN